MYMVHYYLQRGFAPDTILSLSQREKMFYMASMILQTEETAAQYKTLLGGKG